MFPLDQIITADDQQVRDVENIAHDDIVEEYLTQHRNGAIFPPLVLRRPGVMTDGNTRRKMARKAGLTEFPAYVVDIPSGDLAKAVGAQLNQMGGVRLTGHEAQRVAMILMGELKFTDAQIGAIIGRSGQKVKAWRMEIEAAEHAERTSVTAELANVPPSQHRVIARVIQDRPFTELVKLTADRRVPHAEVSRIVREIEAAPSEDEAVAVVDRARTDLRATGPGAATVAVNMKARRMRMLLPQMLNLAPPLDVYEPSRAVEDRAAWLQIKAAADSMLTMYDQMMATTMAAAPDDQEQPVLTADDQAGVA